MNITKKLYYDDVFLSKCVASIIDIKDNAIITDQTVAFPEGGGQDGDTGVISKLDSGISVVFSDTQKGLGKTLFLENFPTINVNCPVLHICQDDISDFKIGDKIQVEIDINKRAGVTIHHTGLHVLIMLLEKNRPDIYKSIKGCHISASSARVDFKIENKISPEEILQVTEELNGMVNRDIPVVISAHSDEPEARYWICDNVSYPCGGTHLPSLAYLGVPSIKRKSKSKGLQRITVEFSRNSDILALYS